MNRFYESGRSTVFGLALVLMLCLSTATATTVINATNPYSVQITDTNGNTNSGGQIADVAANYSGTTSALSNSFFTNVLTNATAQVYTNTAYPLMVPAFQAPLGITVAQLHQACQAWFGYSGTDGGSFQYLFTNNTSLAALPHAVGIGDSLMIGTGALPSNGPGGGDIMSQLGETYTNWASVFMVNNGHGANALVPALQADYVADLMPWRPRRAEHAYVFMFTGATDIYQSHILWPALITATSNYVGQCHTNLFVYTNNGTAYTNTMKVVLINQPNVNGNYWGATNSQTYTNAANYNANITNCGADYYVDAYNLIGANSNYVDQNSLPHLTNAGYGVIASNINYQIPNP